MFVMSASARSRGSGRSPGKVVKSAAMKALTTPMAIEMKPSAAGIRPNGDGGAVDSTSSLRGCW